MLRMIGCELFKNERNKEEFLCVMPYCLGALNEYMDKYGARYYFEELYLDLEDIVYRKNWVKRVDSLSKPRLDMIISAIESLNESVNRFVENKDKINNKVKSIENKIGELQKELEIIKSKAL